MADLLPRRAILRGLASLPLIGGGVTLIGQPTASAEPITTDLMDAYNQWLFYERRLLIIEQFGKEKAKLMESGVPCTPAGEFHFPMYPVHWDRLPQPSSRAALVLSAVGCDWKST